MRLLLHALCAASAAVAFQPASPTTALRRRQRRSPARAAVDIGTSVGSLDDDNKMRWRKGCKQVATLGPVSNDKATIETLFKAGVDVFRLNMSHGYKDKIELIKFIRELEAEHNHPIGILADLQGPKQRCGMFDEPVTLEDGQPYTFDLNDEVGSMTRAQLPHPEIIKALADGANAAPEGQGTVLLIDDGKVRMRVLSGDDEHIKCVVEVGGKLSSRKGVNTPDVIQPISAMTEKDKHDLEFVMATGEIDWVALSFVQQPSDMQELRDIIGNKAKTLAKIEKPMAVELLQPIVDSCDGIMVARGDLGVEMNPEDVPIVQKIIIDECRAQGKPVIVATQMLESMIDNPIPTRAECSDISTAIFDGADAVMLSGESAAGRFPVEAVLMQQRVINRVERSKAFGLYTEAGRLPGDGGDADAIIAAARSIVREMGAKLMVCFTESGTTVTRAARSRPGVPILAICSNKETARHLTLLNNVYTATLDPETLDSPRPEVLFRMIEKACEMATARGLVDGPEDKIVMTAGMPFGAPGAANVIRVVPAAGPRCWDGQCTVE